MKKYILLISFCLLISSLSYGGSFSWSEDVSKEPLSVGRNPASRKSDLKTRKLKAVDPNSFRFRDHRGKKKLTVLVFGDPGTGGKDQYHVAKKMHEECQKEGCDLSLVLGDIIYEKGFSNSRKGGLLSKKDHHQVNQKFEIPYKDFKSFDFWLVPGNHDWYGDIQHSINYTQKSVRWKMPFNHYEVPWLPRWVRMFGLDTTRIERLDFDSGMVKEQMDAANNKYQASMGLGNEDKEAFCKSKGWKIVFGHHGIYSSGWHGRMDMAKPSRMLNIFRQRWENKSVKKKLLPFIKKCGVQIYAVGHDHHQEHIKAVDPKTKKLVFHEILQGAAGKSRRTYRSRHPGFKSLVKNSMFGFSILTFTPDKVRVRYYGYPKRHPEKYSMYYETEILKKDFE